MPVPTPAENETEDKFRSRCMGNEGMNVEYPDNEQRLAVCMTSWRKEHPEAKKPPAERTMLKRSIDLAEMKVDSGGITGYAVTWEFASDGFQYKRGSFTKSIKEQAGKIPLMVAHAREGGSDIFETVGFLTSLVEDDKGLLITAKFLDTDLAKKTREHALVGGVKCMSIQARPIKYTLRSVDKTIVVEEAAIIECTLTNIPADIDAEVLSVRSAEAAAAAAALPDGTAKPLVDTDTSAAVLRDCSLTILELTGGNDQDVAR